MSRCPMARAIALPALLAFSTLSLFDGAGPPSAAGAKVLGARVSTLAGTRARGVRVPAPRPELPTLSLHGLNTNEDLEVAPFDEAGAPREEAFSALRRFFRSSGNHETDIDPRLVRLLVDLSEAYEKRPIVLVSGHRRPGRGTSRGSFHVRGMAADIAIRGVPTRELRETAIRLGARGAGLYPSFVHVDVRETPYRWVGGGPRRPVPARPAAPRVDPYDEG